MPPDLARGDADEIMRFYTDKFWEKYDAECSSALHRNKTMKNLHIHLVFFRKTPSGRIGREGGGEEHVLYYGRPPCENEERSDR